MERAIKPELVAPSGTHGYEPGRIVTDTELSVVAAWAGISGRILGADLGTSYATALVARVALGVLARYPDFSANLTRALVLLGAQPTWNGDELEITGAVQPGAKKREAVRQLVGYGQPTLESALEVTAHRAVLIAEASIPMDGVHVYDLPIPSSFYQSGGRRYLDVALAFDPPARSQRLDYLGNKIEFYVVRNIEIDELVDVFAKFSDQDLEDDEEPPNIDGAGNDHPGAPDADAIDDEGDTTPPRQPGISEALGSRLIKLDTTLSERSRSANQRGSVMFSQRWNDSAAGKTYIVVRSVNRWCDNSLIQPYALTVSLRRDAEQAEIYTELAAQLEAVIEVEPELEVELES